MRIPAFAFLAAVGGLAFGTPIAFAEDPPMEEAPKKEEPKKEEPKAKPASTEVVFGDGAAKFQVTRTPEHVEFRLADPAVKITKAPVVTLTTDSGPRDFTLVAVTDSPGVWRLADPAVVRLERFDARMRIFVEDREFAAPVVFASNVEFVAVHGGRILTFPDCEARVEVVADPATGTLTIWSANDSVKILDAPVISVTESEGPATVTVTSVEPGVWKVSHKAFRTTTFSGRIRILLDGRPCETALVFAPVPAAGVATRGGTIVTVEGGPRFEVVRQPTGTFVFYALEERIDDRPVVIESPRVVYATNAGPRTLVLEPVPGEPRAWQLVGLEADATPSDARLQFTLFGKSLETRVGLSGIGINLK